MSVLTVVALSIAGLVIGGVAGAIWAMRKPDPNPNGLLARKPE